MIKVDGVSKIYYTRKGPRRVLDNICMEIRRGQKVGILGLNGAGKSTLVRIISGAELPSSGAVHHGMSVSWPLAFSGAFQGSLSGLDNLRFVCRVYNADYEKSLPFVEEFSELGPYLREPVKKYSSGMVARLAFALSIAVDFDCFLIDEIVSVGDSRFHGKCHTELFEKRKDRAMIIVSHNSGYIREHCDCAGVLLAGRLYMFDNVDAGLAFYDAKSA
ncbi:MAG: ABC transporter ATP-binding protein [Syntrophobacteraceae bacterium]|nr:ABC transporter ATP-binding protein [Syntrophobacteraceae bacterium]